MHSKNCYGAAANVLSEGVIRALLRRDECTIHPDSPLLLRRDLGAS